MAQSALVHMTPEALKTEQAMLVDLIKQGREPEARTILGDLLIKENGMLPGPSLEAMITDILQSLMAPA